MTPFMTPASRYAGQSNIRASSKCVVPQQKMNAANRAISPRNGRAARRFHRKKVKIRGMLRYASQTSRSEAVCSQMCPPVQLPQLRRGTNPSVDKRLRTKSSIASRVSEL